MPSIGFECKGSNPASRAKSERDLVVKCETKGTNGKRGQMAYKRGQMANITTFSLRTKCILSNGNRNPILQDLRGKSRLI